MINRLLNWLDASTCNVMAVETIKKELNNAGFAELKQTDKWEIKKGGKYYVTKNGTAIFAFIIGSEPVAKKESPSATNARDFPRTDRFEPIQYLDRLLLYHIHYKITIKEIHFSLIVFHHSLWNLFFFDIVAQYLKVHT